MPLNELLSAERITILAGSDLAGSSLAKPGDRGSVIDAAARLLAGDGEAGVSGSIRDSLRSREQLASTAIGHGVAIPHGRVSCFERSRGAFLRLAEPVDFGAADGEPVDLVLAMAVPEHSLQEHLQQLAELAERFADAGFRERLREARDATELGRCLLDGAATGSSRRTAA